MFFVFVFVFFSMLSHTCGAVRGQHPTCVDRMANLCKPADRMKHHRHVTFLQIINEGRLPAGTQPPVEMRVAEMPCRFHNQPVSKHRRRLQEISNGNTSGCSFFFSSSSSILNTAKF